MDKNHYRRGLTCPECGKTICDIALMCKPCWAKHRQATNPNLLPGAKSPAWKGGRYVTGCGYVHIKCPTHPYANPRGYIYEHRLVMEAHLGRILLPTEVVHHVNGIKTDNRIENLMLLSNQGEHRKQHGTRSGTHGRNKKRQVTR